MVLKEQYNSVARLKHFKLIMYSVFGKSPAF